MSIGKSLKANFKLGYDPYGAVKDSSKFIKHDLKKLQPKIPGESEDAARFRERQVLQLADMDRQENSRIKRLMDGSRSLRVFRGSTASKARAPRGLIT